jgi:hypothetical protein
MSSALDKEFKKFVKTFKGDRRGINLPIVKNAFLNGCHLGAVSLLSLISDKDEQEKASEATIQPELEEKV